MLTRRWIGLLGAVSLIVVGIASVPALAGEWVVAADNGCKVWNPNPQLDESAKWSGDCANGRAEGSGTLEWIKNRQTVETDQGEWHEGKQTGKGKQSWGSGHYEGELAGGEPEGAGTLTIKNLRYEGQFHGGRPNGSGTLTVGSQAVSGNWKDGCLQGARKASIGVPLSACR